MRERSRERAFEIFEQYLLFGRSCVAVNNFWIGTASVGGNNVIMINYTELRFILNCMDVNDNGMSVNVAHLINFFTWLFGRGKCLMKLAILWIEAWFYVTWDIFKHYIDHVSLFVIVIYKLFINLFIHHPFVFHFTLNLSNVYDWSTLCPRELLPFTIARLYLKQQAFLPSNWKRMIGDVVNRRRGVIQSLIRGVYLRPISVSKTYLQVVALDRIITHKYLSKVYGNAFSKENLFY